ncbi:lysophospholipase [Pacificibacter maritimus]|uniref:Lysophospholipase n=1 Tax=Pacificibacter maritimus TaxID=762213 RepID=A0A3N4UMY9_9RHOB|nr:alpha/beta hydrolase [Pacificibacter maritimus]RPE71972.1 lysophospholipase [Pacificibacter maritimus]
MNRAPYFADICDGPDTGAAYWLLTTDGVQIRAGVWPLAAQSSPAKGTVFILPGRSEYVEKYGRSARDLADRGFASVAIDWRGQGIADRLLPDAAIGHVEVFEDYQVDLAAVLNMARDLDLPKPWFMIGHSMGGAIGLRALLEGAPFDAASFSAPMWGIGLTSIQKTMLKGFAPLLSLFNLDRGHAPGTTSDSYILTQAFDNNSLTTDHDMYEYMRNQLVAQPDLSLGGPSTHWVREAMAENAYLTAQPSPEVPCLCFLGTDETIVNPQAVQDRMARWPMGKLIEVPQARHEIPMEIPQTRKVFFDQSCALFAAQSGHVTKAAQTA